MHESRDDCSLRQNLQNESNRSDGSEKKRREDVSQKEKLLADIFREGEEPLQILKRMAEKKTEGAEYHNPVLTSIKIIAQTVNAVPSQYNCRKTSENLSAGCANGRKALHEQNQTRASGFPFHNFSSSSVGY